VIYCEGGLLPVVVEEGGVVSECESSVGGAVRPRMSGNQSIAQNGWVWVGHAVRTAWRWGSTRPARLGAGGGSSQPLRAGDPALCW
jgi:hypothetical protein